jgi:hypothetical protein
MFQKYKTKWTFSPLSNGKMHKGWGEALTTSFASHVNAASHCQIKTCNTIELEDARL